MRRIRIATLTIIAAVPHATPYAFVATAAANDVVNVDRGTLAGARTGAFRADAAGKIAPQKP